MEAGKLLEEARRLLRDGALDQATRHCTDILRGDPANAGALLLLAQIACMQGRLDDGVALARRSLAAEPAQARAHNLLGQALSALGRQPEALASFDAAIAADPNLADAHGNRGDALAALGRRPEAIASYDRAIALAPQSFENWCNRGAALYELQSYEAAAASFERALALDPGHAPSHVNRGNALAALARYDDALAAYDAALALAPDHRDAMHNRGCLLSKLGRYGDAAAAFERVLTLAPEHPSAASELAHCHLFTCDWESLACTAGRLDASIADPRSSIPPFTLLELAIEPERLFACNARYVARQVPNAAPFAHRRGPAAGRIRLAYLGDFNRHPVSYLTAGLFEQHDRARFEVTGMAFGRDDGSDIRARIARSFDRFIDATSLTDDEAARRLHERGIDIAVDLIGHTENARPGVLARRPAPVQVSYLGYLATMGAAFIDYVMADAIVLPFDQQPFYAERIVQLPDCFMVQDRGQDLPLRTTRAQAGLPDHGFVFCSFNHSYKIREPVFAIWMQLLRDVEDSVLWLLGTNPQAEANLRREAAKRAVDPARLIFARRAPLPDHLDRQRLADLFLDTVPYNAGATAGAALWAGVPVLACLGSGMVGRMAASMLHAVGLPELVAASLAEYAALAQTLARDPARLAALRQRLAQNRLDKPLFDTARFARHIETAYATMHDTWQRGRPPEPFAVRPIASA